MSILSHLTIKLKVKEINLNNIIVSLLLQDFLIVEVGVIITPKLHIFLKIIIKENNESWEEPTYKIYFFGI